MYNELHRKKFICQVMCTVSVSQNILNVKDIYQNMEVQKM